MPSGKYDRTQSPALQARAQETKDDTDRALLCLLPGKIRMKQLIEREARTLRAQIEAGRRELIALLPGLEVTMQHVTEGLDAFFADTSHRTNGHESKPESKVVRQLVGADKTEKTRSVDVNTLSPRAVFTHPRTGERGISLRYRIVEHFVRHNQELVANDFINKWVGEYPSLKDRTILQAGISALRKMRGLDIRTTKNGYILKTVLTGELKSPDEQVVPLPLDTKNKFEGTRSEVLLHELAANNNRVNINEIAKKYGLSAAVFHPTIHDLKLRKGARFNSLGHGNYIMTKPPKGTTHA